MRAFSIFTLALLPQMSLGQKLSYFDSKIDFWGAAKPAGKESPLPQLSIPEGTVRSDAEKFPWKTYLDPKNKEFFKEGDYTPPEPFMEIARNPSDENIKNWFEFMKKKNELAKRLDERVREYLVKVGQGPIPMPSPDIQPRPQEGVDASAPLEAGRFKVRMYFESTCPHCRKMFGVLDRLQKVGVEVHALQIDRGELPDETNSVSVGFATEEEVKKHGINGVPFVVIADTKRKALLPPLQGFHEFDEVVRLLKSASR